MKTLTTILITILILLSACTQPTPQKQTTTEQNKQLCIPPYYEWMTGTCCLDQNNNNICDLDEKTAEDRLVEPQKEPTASQQPGAPQLSAQDMLKKALNKVVKITINSGGTTYIGSGFIVSGDGYILSNMHVFEPILYSFCYHKSLSLCMPVTIELMSGEKFLAEAPLSASGFIGEPTEIVKLIGVNKPYDFALLKINTQEKLDYFEFANSDKINTGDSVFALGSPEGLAFSASKGVISAKNREGFNDKSVKKYIQTDAAINHGNSGGPLIDEEGKVVGMNTFGFEKSIAEGLNFALESNVAKEFYETLKEIKVGMPSKTCFANEGTTALDCEHALIKSPNPKSVPDAEVEISKLDIDGVKTSHTAALAFGANLSETGTLNPYSLESDITMEFYSFSVAMKNNMNETKEICFNLKVIENGIKIKDEIINAKILLKPKLNLQETIPISRVETQGDTYAEINVLDCGNPSKIYATSYARY